MIPALQPLDRVAITVSLLLVLAIGLLLWQGDRTAPQVRHFSWAKQEVNAEKVNFLLTFSRPMDHRSVEANLQINPSLSGKFSWAGRTMAYTLTKPAPYGQAFELTLAGAYDQFTRSSPSRLFKSNFSTPDRVFAYLGITGEEKGRIVLHNLSRSSHQILTPRDQIVTDFRIYPDRSHILYTAIPGTGQGNILEQELYRVSTGVNAPMGKVERILDAKEYQLFKFDLSPDGSTIVVQRLSRSVQGNYGLWQIKDGKITALSQPPGGDFKIAPDNTSLAITQGEGVAILSLAEQVEPLDFLPKFGNILSFNRDGSQAAMIKFNKDYTRSLFLVNNRGEEEKLLTIPGSILYAQFDFSSQTLYALLTEVEQRADTYQEHPFLVAIDIANKTMKTLLKLRGQRNLHPTLSPDDSSLLFEVKQANTPETIYQLSLSEVNAESALQSLQLSGTNPRWLL